MVSLIQYNITDFDLFEDISPATLAKKINPEKVNWIDVETSDKDIVEELSRLFNIHPLITEDILNIEHLPKFEAFEDHIFLSLKMLRYHQDTGAISQEHLNIVLGKTQLITFQEGLPGDVFENLRIRLKQGKGLIRNNGLEYLLYHCLDAVVDNYMHISETLRDKMEEMETRLIHDPSYEAPEKVMQLKKKGKYTAIIHYTVMGCL